MQTIDIFEYQKKPFSHSRYFGIHPLDENGLHKYFFSKESYTQTYLNRPISFSSTFQSSTIPHLSQTIDTSTNIQHSETQPLSTNVAVTQPQLIPSKQKYKITTKTKPLPSLKKSDKFRKKYGNISNNRYHRYYETEIGKKGVRGISLNGKVQQKRKLKLPDIMRMTKPPELTIRSIDYYNKCMGEKYDPTCMFFFTSSNVGRNFVGAKYQH